MLAQLRNKNWSSLFRFGVVGAINTAIDFAVFFTLYSLFAVHLVIANVIAFLAAVTNSYLLNKFWSFNHLDSGPMHWRQFFLFATISVLALSVNTAILVIGEPYLPILLLKIIGAVVVPLINFVGYRYVVFATIHSKNPSPISSKPNAANNDYL